MPPRLKKNKSVVIHIIPDKPKPGILGARNLQVERGWDGDDV